MRIKIDPETCTVTIPHDSDVLVDLPTGWIVRQGYRTDKLFVEMVRLRRYARILFDRNAAQQFEQVQYKDGSIPSVKVHAISYIRHAFPNLGDLAQVKSTYEFVHSLTQWEFEQACQDNGIN